ncbi:hypothetical protein F511_22621 [Dorcoceras hygrometricum]|uniref:Helicase domain-containing family protein n=1 Tax=Dorcoceras hygrometricum TaxID=472368 RepID=A0A2Z7AJW7_9LAMI|nr:hypothetical protein F511_22621 [Dorcoceras hygrometricum]
MVVDLIGIYGLKGPYCMLTTTNWFLQALSMIPRGSWGDVARRSYHDPMGKSGIVIPEPQWLWAHVDRSDLIGDRSYDEITVIGMNRMFIRWTRARWAGPSPSLIYLRLLRRLNFASMFCSGLSRAAREVFGPILDIGAILVDFEILRFLGPKLFLAQYDAIKNCKIRF